MITPKASDNPYFSARRSWNDHVGKVVAASRIWQTVSIASLVIAAVSVIGMVSIAKQSRFVPYVVEVDKLGQVAAVQPASQITSDNLDRVIKATLASWIAKARLVTPDQLLQAKAIREVYANLASDDPATNKMNAFYNGTTEENPFVRSTKVLVSASINAVIPESADSWQVDWTETVTTRQGEPKSVTNMRALITIRIVPPTSRTSEEEIRANPIGLYVKDFSWTQIGV